MAKHNKKRNVGLLHEQLVRHASQMTVEKQTKLAESAIQIITSHFSKGSELLKEFRLFSALIHTEVPDRSIAKRIIEELAKAAAEGRGAAQLDGRMIDAASERMAENIVNINNLIQSKK